MRPEQIGESADVAESDTEKKLSAMLYSERGYHFIVLAEEYDAMSREFAAKAARARREYESYRRCATACLGERLGAECERIWDENAR